MLLLSNARCDVFCGGDGPMASWPQEATGRGKLSSTLGSAQAESFLCSNCQADFRLGYFFASGPMLYDAS